MTTIPVQFAQTTEAYIEYGYANSLPDSVEGRMVQQMDEMYDEIQKLFAEGLVEASGNYAAAEGQKNTTREGGVKMQARTSGYDYSKPFSQQLEDYQNGLIPNGDTLLVGPTPDVLKGIGLTALPVTINTTQIDYSLNGSKDFDYYLGKALMSQLPETIKRPVAIMTSGTKFGSSLVIMLKIRNNGKQVVVPMVVDGFGKNNGLRIGSNAITSAYSKDHSIARVPHDAIGQESKG